MGTGTWLALHETWWRMCLAAILGMTAVRALRYVVGDRPEWLDAALGRALVLQFVLLFNASLILTVQLVVLGLLVLGLVVRRRWLLRRDGRRWVLQPWVAMPLWGLLVADGMLLDLHPHVTGLYVVTLGLLVLAYRNERRKGTVRRGRVFLAAAAVALVGGWLGSSWTVVDACAVLGWLALALPLCLLALTRLRARDALAGLLLGAVAHQAVLSLVPLALPATVSHPQRTVLGEGNAYSFCEMPDRHRVFAALPSCVGTQVDACRDDVIAEYDSRNLVPTRRYAPFDATFHGRMLHLVCLDDSILVGMAFTYIEPRMRRENVMELSVRDGRVLRRDVAGHGFGHRLLRHPDGGAVFAVSEYSNRIAHLPLGGDASQSVFLELDRSIAARARSLGPIRFRGSLQTEVAATRAARASGFFAEWVFGRRVHEVDLDDGRLLASWATNNGGNHSLAVDDARDRLIVTGLWGVEVIDLGSGRVVQRRRTELGPRLPVIDTRRDLVYVSTTFGNHIWVFDRETFALRGKLLVGAGARNMHLTSDGRYLLSGGAGRHVAWDLERLAAAWLKEPTR